MGIKPTIIALTVLLVFSSFHVENVSSWQIFLNQKLIAKSWGDGSKEIELIRKEIKGTDTLRLLYHPCGGASQPTHARLVLFSDSSSYVAKEHISNDGWSYTAHLQIREIYKALGNKSRTARLYDQCRESGPGSKWRQEFYLTTIRLK